MLRHAIRAAAILLTLVAPALAQAQAQAPAQAPAKKLLVLPLEALVIDDAEKAEYDAMVVTALRPYRNFELLPKPTDDPLEVMMELECFSFDDACAKGFQKRYGADAVLRVAITDEGTLRAQLYSGAAAPTVLELEPSADAPLGTLAGKIVAGVFGAPPKAPPADGLLVIETSPKGATVFVNGKPYGPAPTEKRFPPGTYTVTAKLADHEDDLKEVTLASGQTLSVALAPRALKPVTAVGAAAATTTAVAATPIYEKWWFWTAIGVGTAAILAPTIYYLTRPGDAPSGSMDLVIHPVTFQDDALLRP